VANTTVGLILGLAFVVVALVLGLRLLSRPGGGRLEASADAFGMKGRIALDTRGREQVERSLDEATSKKNLPEGSATAKRELARTTSIQAARILWVDDNPDWNITESLMLRDLGLSILQALTTADAIRYLEEGEFDLLITDLTRGEDRGAGLDLLRAVAHKAFPKIVYAGEPLQRTDVALSLGARAVTTTPGQLLEAVLSVIS
jgi:CheY-like chemotaxis protein